MSDTWVRITDSRQSLPPKNRRVLIAVLQYSQPQGVCEGYWNGEQWCTCQDRTLYEDQGYTVSHWMPMPEFPKE